MTPPDQKLKVRYHWQVRREVKGTASIDVPQDLKGCRSIEDYVLNYAPQIIGQIAEARGIEPHCGDVMAGLETGCVGLRVLPTLNARLLQAAAAIRARKRK